MAYGACVLARVEIPAGARRWITQRDDLAATVWVESGVVALHGAELGGGPICLAPGSLFLANAGPETAIVFAALVEARGDTAPPGARPTASAAPPTARAAADKFSPLATRVVPSMSGHVKLTVAMAHAMLDSPEFRTFQYQVICASDDLTSTPSTLIDAVAEGDAHVADHPDHTVSYEPA